jgi:hypothetical protein
MLTSSARALLFEGRDAHVARKAAVVGNVRRVLDQRAIGNSLLDCYLEGWAEANPAKIIAATSPGYRFCDPFVGTFLRRTIHEYFDLLQDGLSRAGVIRRPDVAFFLRGPMDQRSPARELQFWREAPRIGLTGVSKIDVGQRGIIAESVAYDLNLASDTLRREFERSFG